MSYPKKIEINVENDAQLAILYSCFNVCTDDVIANLNRSSHDKIRKISTYFKDVKNKENAGDYILYCWKKVNDFITDNFTIPKIKDKDNIAKIIIERHKKNNIEYYKILEFKNIKNRAQLPNKYFENYPQFYLITNNALKFKYLDSKNNVKVAIFRKFCFCETIKFVEFLEIMKKAGKRLTQIYREEKQLSIPKLSVIQEFFI